MSLQSMPHPPEGSGYEPRCHTTRVHQSLASETEPHETSPSSNSGSGSGDSDGANSCSSTGASCSTPRVCRRMTTSRTPEASYAEVRECMGEVCDVSSTSSTSTTSSLGNAAGTRSEGIAVSRTKGSSGDGDVCRPDSHFSAGDFEAPRSTTQRSVSSEDNVEWSALMPKVRAPEVTQQLNSDPLSAWTDLHRDDPSRHHRVLDLVLGSGTPNQDPHTLSHIHARLCVSSSCKSVLKPCPTNRASQEESCKLLPSRLIG
ncbi:unnamed protein product [Protopolystoma xenopodis]|uniref:Uncharacterized protein n=1 Tax=Protopolystoma xenopodis TaxID=117903 RepID=A0A3S5FCK4_9PLAT|nr:unnamed protein product [Protopolystoma xenopodis]